MARKADLTTERPLVTRIAWVEDKKTGIKYEEERTYQYDPKAKYNRLKGNKRTGRKLMPGAIEPVATRPRKAKAKTTESTAAQTKVESTEATAARVKNGATEIIQWASKKSGLTDCVKSAFPLGGEAAKVLSVGQYLVATGEPVHNIVSYQLEHDLPYSEGISEDGCYDLFSDIGTNEQGIQSLFQSLASLAGHKSPIVALDSTTISTYSTAEGGLTPMARPGFNKDGDGLDTFKLITFYSPESRLPVSFEMQPGNIPDITSVLNSVTRAKSYGFSTPLFVLDNGFFSKSNVALMCRSHVKFSVRASLGDKWIASVLGGDKKLGTEGLHSAIDGVGAVCPFDTNIHGAGMCQMTPLSWTRQKTRGDNVIGQEEKQSFRLYYHFFVNEFKRTEAKNNLYAKIFAAKASLEQGGDLLDGQADVADKFLTVKTVKGKKLSVTLNTESIEQELKNYGMFCILSNTDKDSWNALKHYRMRSIIEDSYRIDKTFLDGKRARCWTEKSVRGKEVCRLVAIGLRFYLADAFEKVRLKALANSSDKENFTARERDGYTALVKWLESMTVAQILAWFDCIETVRVSNRFGNRRWTTENIARDRLFLQMLKAL